jgi:hypothetical protein
MWLLLRLSATKPLFFTIHVLTFHFVVANNHTFHQLVAIEKSYVFDLTFHQLVAIEKSYVFTVDLTFHQLVAIEKSYVFTVDLTFHQLVALEKSYVFDLTFHQLVAIDKCCSVQRVFVLLFCLHSIDWTGAVRHLGR